MYHWDCLGQRFRMLPQYLEFGSSSPTVRIPTCIHSSRCQILLSVASARWST